MPNKLNKIKKLHFEIPLICITFCDIVNKFHCIKFQIKYKVCIDLLIKE